MKNKNINNTDSDKAVLQDIQAGFELFDKNPPPVPSDQTLSIIKRKMNSTIKKTRQQKAIKRYIKRIISVAAIVLILLTINFKLHHFKQPISTALIAQDLWEASDISSDDIYTSTLAQEIDELNNDIFAAKFDYTTDAYHPIETDNMEIEIIKTNTDFWKG